MNELQKEYVILFNGITEVMDEMERLILRMQQLQQEAENYVLEDARHSPANLTVLPVEKVGENGIRFCRGKACSQ